MSESSATVDEDGGREYDLDYIIANGIPAKCKKCRREFYDNQVNTISAFVGGRFIEKQIVTNEAINAPDLKGCRCSYCGGELGPLVKGGPTTVEQVEQVKARDASQPMLEIF